MSAAFATSCSPCPTPTVSNKIKSFPLAANTSPASWAFLAKPPKSPWLPILRINTLLSHKYLFIRTRSPSKAPPVKGLVGSTAITPTVLFFERHVSINSLVRVLFPDPGGPVIPIRIDPDELAWRSL